ncbi:glycosyltransferase [Candidatus Laterigemmans baculatus]|uniref:glycosyltransferase n=1 Tax=Candidatus Laterigemmans baculatus TaxID=2770505 RepID=UPI0013DBC951|nr:glycosyltransferase [Candidatus Laterigemmans baculatus]
MTSFAVDHVIDSIHPQCGGPSQSVPALCEGLSGCDVKIVLHSRDFGRYRSHEVRCQLISVRDAARGRFGVNPQILHVHAIWNPCSSFAMRATRRRGVPYVVSPRGMLHPDRISSFKKVLWRWMLESENLRNATVIHVTSRAELETVQACGWELPPIAVIPNAVQSFGRLPNDGRVAADAPPQIACIGRVAPIKQMDVLIRTMPAVIQRFPGARLRIIGPDESNLVGAYKSLCRELGIVDAVEFTGELDRQGIADKILQSHLVVMPSRSENFGMAAAEAMSLAVPVVLSSGVGIAADANRAGAALVVDPKPDLLAAAIGDLLSSAERRKQMGRAASNFIQSEFSVESVAQRMKSVYEWVLFGGAPPECVVRS